MMKKIERKEPPPGMVTERVLRGLIRTVARKLKDTSLTPKDSLALLKEQRKLAKQLQASVAAQTAMDLDDRRTRERARSRELTEVCPKDGTHDGP
jgi:hypothetical protein